MDWNDLATYVGAAAEDSDFVQQCWDEAKWLVASFIGGAEVPEEIGDRACLEVGSELYHRRNAPNGIARFASFDGNPVRVARDPMVAAYPILSRFMVVGL